MTMKPILVLAGLFAALLAANASAADRTILYLAHLNKNEPTNPTGAMAMTFERETERGSEGSLDVEVFPDGQLGSEAMVVDLVRRGIIQSAIVSVAGLAGIYPQVGVLNFPFRFRDLADAYAAFDGRFGRYMAEDIERKAGLAVLGYGDTGGLFVLTNSRRPVHSPEDMEGLKIRTMSLDSHKAFVKSVGGVPVPMAWGELYAALQNRAIDGQMNPASIVLLGNLDKVQKYLTVTNHLYTPYIWVANPAFLASLTPAEREAVRQAAANGVAASRRLSAASDSLKGLAGAIRIYRPSDEERKRFQEATQPAMARFIEENLGEQGTALLAIFREGAEAE